MNKSEESLSYLEWYLFYCIVAMIVSLAIVSQRKLYIIRKNNFILKENEVKVKKNKKTLSKNR